MKLTNIYQGLEHKLKHPFSMMIWFSHTLLSPGLITYYFKVFLMVKVFFPPFHQQMKNKVIKNCDPVAIPNPSSHHMLYPVWC